MAEQLGADSEHFTGRIDRRLSSAFGASFAVVLAVGGVSLYLLGSVLYQSEEIARQSEQVHLVERISRRLHDMFLVVHVADDARRRAAIESIRKDIPDLQAWLSLYKKAGPRETDAEELSQIIAHAATLYAGLSGGTETADRVAASQLQEIAGLRERLRRLTDRVVLEHEVIEEQHVPQTNRKMKLTIAFNLAFVLLGAGFVLATKGYFQRAIAAPLRRLAEGSRAIARGDLPETIPVTSNDEIGLLSRSFNQMARQLKSSEEELKKLAILQERERLAHELHDSLAQDLAFVRLKLIEAKEILNSSASAEAKRAVNEILEAIDVAYQELRQAIFGLHTLSSKPSGGLIAVLREYLRDFSAVRHMPLELHPADPPSISLRPEVEAQLFRILHEALTNIVKHAHASRGTVTIEKDQTLMRVTITDDGEGSWARDGADKQLHFGLRTMKDRAEGVGGTLSIRSGSGKGTSVVVELPLAQELANGSHSNIARG